MLSDNVLLEIVHIDSVPHSNSFLTISSFSAQSNKRLTRHTLLMKSLVIQMINSQFSEL